MYELRRILGLSLVLVLLVAAAGLAQTDTPKKPLTEAALLKLIKSDLEEEVIVTLIKKRGVDFPVTAEALGRLKEGGATNAVLAAVKAQGAREEAKKEEKPAANAAKPLGTGKYQKGLVIDVTELKRTSDNYLKVSFRIRNPTEQSVTYTVSGVYFVPDMYYIDAGGKLKYHVLRDTKGNYIASHVPGTVTLGTNETADFWAKFPQPAAGVKHITLYFRQAEPIEDVPVPAPEK
jgi:hypothetical protein